VRRVQAQQHVQRVRQRHAACVLPGLGLFVHGGFDGTEWLGDAALLSVRELFVPIISMTITLAAVRLAHPRHTPRAPVRVRHLVRHEARLARRHDFVRLPER
jgi:hypothetical protein